MENFNVEIRDNRLHLSGYVNAVERDSRVIDTLDGRCVEQIAAGAFAKSLEDGHEVRMKLNHKRCIGSTTDGTIVTLREDNVGLYAQTVTDDEELRTLAAENRLTGWSFGFVKKDGSIEERGKDVPRRRITALDLTEISILSVTPAYYGNSVETREDTTDASAENEETRSCEDYELRSDGEPDQKEPAAEKTENGLDPEEVRAKVDQFLLGEKIKEIRRRGEEIRLRLAWLDIKEKGYELEERYNHYHDPHNGRFASGAGGGAGLYYSMGKGKGEIIGASSPYQPPRKTLDKTKINRANAQNSMLYDAGSAIEKQYNSEYDEIGKLNLTAVEKTAARERIYQYSSDELNARQGFVGTYVAGPARAVGARSDRALDKATSISGEHSAYMKDLRRKSAANDRKQSEKKLSDALVKAMSSGQTEITIDGKSYYRSNKKSSTWHEGTKKPKGQKQLSFF